MGTVHAKDKNDPESVSAIDDKGKKINLAEVSARIDKVHIEGLRRTKDDVVVETVQDLFASNDFAEVITNANRVRHRLEELGCFRQVDIFIDTSTGKEASKDGLEVTFFVRELNRIKGNIHTLVGNDEGCLAFGGQAPNLFGRGEKLQFDASYGARASNNLDLSFTKPLRTKNDAIWRASIFQQKGDFPASGYRLTDRAFLLDLAFSSLPKVRHNLQYEGAWRELGQCSKTDALVVRKEYGHSLKSAIRHIVSLDKRDSAIFPTEGALLRITSELAGLGGNIGFLKNDVQMQVNLPLFSGIVFQGTAQAGILRPMFEGKHVTIADKFFLGGPTSVRGFQNRGIGPHVDKHAIGANLYWATGVHLYSPLPFRPGRSAIGDLFRLHLFATLGQCDDITFSEDMKENFLKLVNEYRASCGGGIALRIMSAAQLELNFVVPIFSRSTDAKNPGVQFGLGVQFL